MTDIAGGSLKMEHGSMPDQDTLDTREVLAAWYCRGYAMQRAVESGEYDDDPTFLAVKQALIAIKDRVRKETWKELRNIGGD